MCRAANYVSTVRLGVLKRNFLPVAFLASTSFLLKCVMQQWHSGPCVSHYLVEGLEVRPHCIGMCLYCLLMRSMLMFDVGMLRVCDVVADALRSKVPLLFRSEGE